jgi:hypothetical protein
MRFVEARPYADPATAARRLLEIALDYAIAKGWLWKHESGTYVKFTQAGADLFA